VENAAPGDTGGKRGSGKRGTKFRGRIQDFKLGGVKQRSLGDGSPSPPVGSRSKAPVGSLEDGGAAPRRSSSSMNFYQHGSVASHACAGIAIAEMSVRLSVCLSIRLSVTLWYCIKKRTKLSSCMVSSLMPDGERKDSSFCKYPVHPKIRKGSH